MLGSTSRLLLAIAAAWGLLVVPAYLAAGIPGVLGVTAAAVLCLAPGLVVLMLQFGPLAECQPLAGLVVGMGLRLACVLAAVVAVLQLRPDLPAMAFVVWVVPMYLVALAVETHIAMSLASRSGGRPSMATQARPAGSPQ